MNSYAYAGIGSRKTPPIFLRQIKLIAWECLNHKYTLRSGGAKGADTAFEEETRIAAKIFHITPHPQIFLPKPELYNIVSWKEAMEIALEFHPAPDVLRSKQYIMNLMARNSFQVLGADLNTPSDFIVCWTPDGAYNTTSRKTGGTGQAIRIAIAYNIPVYNIAQPTHLDKLIEERLS